MMNDEQCDAVCFSEGEYGTEDSVSRCEMPRGHAGTEHGRPGHTWNGEYRTDTFDSYLVTYLVPRVLYELNVDAGDVGIEDTGKVVSVKPAFRGIETR